MSVHTQRAHSDTRSQAWPSFLRLHSAAEIQTVQNHFREIITHVVSSPIHASSRDVDSGVQGFPPGPKNPWWLKSPSRTYQVMNLGPQCRRTGCNVGTKPGHHYREAWYPNHQNTVATPLSFAPVLGDSDRRATHSMVGTTCMHPNVPGSTAPTGMKREQGPPVSMALDATTYHGKP